MSAVNLIFPHQLFPQSELIDNGLPVYLIEEWLFFKHFNFHQQKLAFHRASMKYYENYLLQKRIDTTYIESRQAISDIRVLIKELATQQIDLIHFIDPTDNWLEKRISQTAQRNNIQTVKYTSPLFLNTPEDLATFFKPTKSKFFQTSFYKQQRVRRNILVDDIGEPIGGKWSFDADNRKKYPKKKQPPAITYPEIDNFYKEAIDYTEQYFSNNLGKLSPYPLYPHTFESTKQWFNQFLNFRFTEFGAYEDAMVAEYSILNHSVLTPMLNVGLISPQAIIDQALLFAKKHEVPINSLEGFIRQIIGWREFIRGMYECKGTESRTKNFWGFKRKIPKSFYDGTTGIPPIDKTIQKILQTGYCHHIERLMVLGNFMLLCEFDPDEVYRWFMELFIDAYDWVMVPNIYGMSQFADGGFFATKPYISGSSYLLKMSNYKKGDWQETWDGLFWRFMNVNRAFFLKNPRLGMLVSMYDKMSDEKQNTLNLAAIAFLEKFRYG